MSLRINNNIASVNGHRNMIRNDSMVSKSLEKLSSGLRINRAADDAAGLIISEQMRAQLAGLEQASANSEQAVGVVQTAEGSLDEMNTLLKKARQLAIHSANSGVNDSNALAADQTELDNIVNSITRIAANTQFGTKKILDGTLSGAVANVATITTVTVADPTKTTAGIYNLDMTAGASLTVSAASGGSLVVAGTSGASGFVAAAGSLANIASTSALYASTTLAISGSGVAVTVAAGTTVQAALDTLNTAAAAANVGIRYDVAAAGHFVATALDVGSYSNSLDLVMSTGADNTITMDVSTSTGTQGSNEQSRFVHASTGDQITLGLAVTNRGRNFESSAPTGLDLQVSFTSAAVDVNSALEIRSGAIFQIGANRGQTTAVAINSMKATDIGKGASYNGTTEALYTSLDVLRTGSALTSGHADRALTVIDQAINDITNTRGKLGAVQADTLETTLNSLRVTQENLTAGESTIRDVDFAKESATFTKYNILMQSATAMLAQANQLPQGVLKLLG